jgi:hypothetical protein
MSKLRVIHSRASLLLHAFLLPRHVEEPFRGVRMRIAWFAYSVGAIFDPHDWVNVDWVERMPTYSDPDAIAIAQEWEV